MPAKKKSPATATPQDRIGAGGELHQQAGGDTGAERHTRRNEQMAGDHTRERDDGAGRQIDAARDDHKRHPDGNDGIDAGLLGDIQEVGHGEEMRGQRPQHRRQDQQPDEGAELPRR